jgi:hypothetical protein
MLFGLALALLLVFFVFGLYREYTARNDQIEWDGLQQFFATRTGEDSPIEWFYRSNIEGFTGLAGLLTYEAKAGGITYDLGLSNLRVVTQFIPYSLRRDPDLPFRNVSIFLISLYPYKGEVVLGGGQSDVDAELVFSSGSVVPAGMENAYAHFGLPGVLVLGILLGYLTRWLHVQMSSPSPDRLMIVLLSVHTLLLIRGSFYHLLLFGLAELVVLWLYRFQLNLSWRLRVSSFLTLSRNRLDTKQK